MDERPFFVLVQPLPQQGTRRTITTLRPPLHLPMRETPLRVFTDEAEFVGMKLACRPYNNLTNWLT